MMKEFGDCEQRVKSHAQVSRSARVLSFSEVGSITGGGGGKECSDEFRFRKRSSRKRSGLGIDSDTAPVESVG